MLFSHLFMLLLLCSLSSRASACSCVPLSFQSRFCDNRTTLSIKAKVIKVSSECDFPTPRGANCFYKLHILRIFKGRHRSPSVFVKSAFGTSCEEPLIDGAVYALNLGQQIVKKDAFPKRYFSIITCTFPTLWKSVSRENRAFLRMASKDLEAVCAPVPTPFL